MTPIEEEIDYEGLPSNAGLGVRFSFYFLLFLLCSSCSFRLHPLLLLHTHALSPFTVSLLHASHLSNMNTY